MKIPYFAFVSYLAFAAAAIAAPRLVVSTPSLVPESQVDIVFDAPVTAAADLGKTVANTWLDIKPALPGKLLWKSPEVLEFLPTAAPKIGTTYTFSIPQGRQHLDGSAVVAGQFGTAVSEAFRVLASNQMNRWESDYTPATSGQLIIFNDGVEPAAAANYVTYYSGDRTEENPTGGQRVAAKLSRPTFDEAGYYAREHKPWADRYPGTPEKEITDDMPVPNALIAKPVSPLPPAASWSITLLKGLPNTGDTARTETDNTYSIGKVEPFAVAEINPVVEADEPRRLVITFNQSLAETLPVDFLEKSISLSPRPANLSATVDGSQIVLEGSFDEADQYAVEFHKPFVSKAGVELAESQRSDVQFERLDPSLILPSETEAQLAHGSRKYRIQTVNMAALHVRVKLLVGDDVVRTYQGFANYTGIGHDGRSVEPTAPLPFQLVVGKIVWEREIALGNPIDTSKEITLDWDEILPGALRNAAVFLDITGTPNPAANKEGGRKAQALLQLTDIGLAWKLTGDEAMVYAFSCDTGAPLPGVKLEFFGDDAAVLRSVTTDETGLATLNRTDDVRTLRATLGSDCYLTAFDSTLDTVGLWHFPVGYSYNKSPKTVRQALLFTDRSLYRPGETVRLKGIVRNREGNAIAPPTPGKARVVIVDPKEKEIFSSPADISENGSFDVSYTLPPDKTGPHQIRLEYPEEIAQAAALEDDWQKQSAILASARFEIPLRVEEFRRNAFEIEQTVTPPAIGAMSVDAELTATYYQGQPVAAGAVKHFSRITSTNLYPERFRDYLFGNHRAPDWRYWYHYFGYRDDESSGSNGPSSQIQGETHLSADGKATISTEIPQADFPTTQNVVISTEVTDANDQTLTATSNAMVHPAAVYVGVSRLDRLVRAGEVVPLKLVATDPDGEPFPGAVQVTATLTREVNMAVKTRNAAGETTTRNDVSEETVVTSKLTIDPAASAGQGTEFSVTPKSTGQHFLTLRGVDPAGHAFATVTSFHVYGTDEFPWRYEDGLRVKLVAEKKSYQPGETARILVLTPIEGTALVTVEREKVLRSFRVALKADQPVIEVPLTADDAPNAFVSVLIIKGAQDSAREHKEPQLRLGYCELIVENQRDRLAVAVQASSAGGGEIMISTKGGKPAPSFRPGDEVTLSGTVMLADGRPAAGAEVTLYAEDEGTLAVMGYETPVPMEAFYQPRLLEVDTGTSFSTFISEDPDSQYFNNKGFFVGGGGGMSELENLLRKNFDPCATWAPALITDAAGKFSHSFIVPDTLTRYRVIAVAHHQITRFGSVESAIVVSKDLMLEPKTPRFANQTDTFETKVLVQNASQLDGTWEIEFATGEGPETPCVSPTGSTTETVTLAAGASATVVFYVRADSTGEAALSWRATPVSLQGRDLTPALVHQLSDAVETRFTVQYPMPLLRQAKLVSLKKGAGKLDLRNTLDARLLDGTGEIELEFSRSPLIEAAGSVDFLLRYPYGCVEQTTSALIPWLSVDALRPVVPAFAAYDAKQVSSAIQLGADRLLSMQLADGSFAYWTGSNESVPWVTSYAGMGLIMAADRGANVPEASIEALKKNLIASLRGIADANSAEVLEMHARTLLVLAKAGSPQVAYRNVLVDRIAELTPAARALLAAATAAEDPASAENRSTARSILTSKVPFKGNDDSWMRWSADDAFQLIAWLAVDPDGAETTASLDKMFRDRNPYGAWRTTWVNGWSLMAMATYAEHEQLDQTPVTVTMIAGSRTETLVLGPDQPTALRTFRLARDLQLVVSSDNKAVVRASVTSKPKITPVQPVAKNGLSVERFYEHMAPDGTASALTEPKVGDLIRVTLRVTLPQDRTRYLIVEDSLPSLFETVNNDFKSQRAAAGIRTSEDDWRISHSELRTDCASFFLDDVARAGTYSLSYLARCTVAGTAIAPPAKVESMYDPENFALSASRVFTTE